MAIERIKIRARVVIGNLSVSTPYVQSFNVRKQRGQVSTFDASLKVSHDEVSGAITGGSVQIYAGEDAASDLIFTGICRAAKISPCYDDPKYVILSISGADQMSLLMGKRFTRRCRSTQAAWIAITGVVREGLKSGKFAWNKAVIEMDGGKLNSDDPRTATTAATVTDKSNTNTAKVKDSNNARPGTPIITILNNDPTAGGGA